MTTSAFSSVDEMAFVFSTCLARYCSSVVRSSRQGTFASTARGTFSRRQSRRLMSSAKAEAEKRKANEGDVVVLQFSLMDMNNVNIGSGIHTIRVGDKMQNKWPGFINREHASPLVFLR